MSRGRIFSAMRVSLRSRALVGTALLAACTAAPAPSVQEDPASSTPAPSVSATGQPTVAPSDSLLGRPGEVSGAESAADRLVVVRTLP